MQRNTPTPKLENFTIETLKSYIWTYMQMMFTKFVQLKLFKGWYICLCKLMIQMHLYELPKLAYIFTHFIQPKDNPIEVSNVHIHQAYYIN
jgi:hypothetical protein